MLRVERAGSFCLPSCACELPGPGAAGVTSLLVNVESTRAFFATMRCQCCRVQSFSARFAAPGTSCCSRFVVETFRRQICATCSPSGGSPCSAFSTSCRIAAVMRLFKAAPSSLPAAGSACSRVRSIALPTLRSKNRGENSSQELRHFRLPLQVRVFVHFVGLYGRVSSRPPAMEMTSCCSYRDFRKQPQR
jgi:hypothetical protein